MSRRVMGIAWGLGLAIGWPSLAVGAPPANTANDPGGAEIASADGAGASPDATEPRADAARSEASRWSRRRDIPWIERWAPEPHMVELGIYGGLFVLNRDHELFAPELGLPDQGWQPLRRLNPTLGARAGYYPLRFFGVEAEGSAVLTALDDGSQRVTPFLLRGQLVGQLGLWSVTPFALVGVGMLGSTAQSPVGGDIDPALHVGGGAKLYLNRWLALRLDVRDVVSHKRGVDNTFVAHNLEVLLGLSVTLNRRNTPPAPRQPGLEPGDRDGDGILDPVDECPDAPETENGFQDDDGCPETDRDLDGFLDPFDSCPDEPGIDPDGCPLRDADGDGILDAADACVDEPETENGFEDDDGCPDELPDAIKRFTGDIEGITFDTNSATIQRSSLPTLDAAIRLLAEYPSVRLSIVGHTDSRGERDHNLELSQARADSVRTYMIGMGIDESRLETRGLGPDKPVESNETKAGRARNRRIEFQIIAGSTSATST